LRLELRLTNDQLNTLYLVPKSELAVQLVDRKFLIEGPLYSKLLGTILDIILAKGKFTSKNKQFI